jgi:hypothetical protein
VITTDDILTSSGKHGDRIDWVSPAVERNAELLATRVTALLLLFGQSRRINSGFRDPNTNNALAKKGRASPYSRHVTGEAADIEDMSGTLGKWALANPDALAHAGLWCEPLHMTPTWLHVQTVPVPGGKRIAP